MIENPVVKKSRRFFLLCGSLLAGPAAAVLIFHHDDRGLMVVMTLLLVAGVFLLGRAIATKSNDMALNDSALAADLAKLAATPAPATYLDSELATYNEVFKPRRFGGFGLSSTLWIQNGVLRSRSALRTKKFPLMKARGYAVFRFQFPREVRVMYLCNDAADSKFAVDLLAFECHSLVRWAQANLTEVSLETLR